MAKRMNPNLSEGLDGDAVQELLAHLRGMLWEQVGENGDFAEIAARAKVHKSTIERFMYIDSRGVQTKRPHFETVVGLLFALNRMSLLREVFIKGSHTKIKLGAKHKRKK